MQWLPELTEKERLLRKDMEHLSTLRRGRDLVSHDARELVMRRIRHRVEEMQLAIDSRLVGGDENERNVISYRVDLELPVYSHLAKLRSLLS